jgi:hypothetical protein
MIPLIVKGVVREFRCSECEWALILEEPFLDSDRARQAKTDKAKEWYSQHECLQFAKSAQKSRAS